MCFFSNKVCRFPKKIQDFTIALCVCRYKKVPKPKAHESSKKVCEAIFHTIKHFFLSLYLLQCVSITSKAPQMKSQSLKLNFSVCFSKHVHNDRDRSNDLWSPALMGVFMSMSKTTMEIVVIMHVFVNRSVVTKYLLPTIVA